MIRHAVFLRLRPDATPTEIDTTLAALKGLKQKIPGITAISIGRDNSPEGLQRGNSIALLWTLRMPRRAMLTCRIRNTRLSVAWWWRCVKAALMV